MDKIILLAEIALKGPSLPCLGVGEEVVSNLRDRFQRGLTEEQLIDHVVRNFSCIDVCFLDTLL